MAASCSAGLQCRARRTYTKLLTNSSKHPAPAQVPHSCTSHAQAMLLTATMAVGGRSAQGGAHLSCRRVGHLHVAVCHARGWLPCRRCGSLCGAGSAGGVPAVCLGLLLFLCRGLLGLPHSTGRLVPHCQYPDKCITELLGILRFQGVSTLLSN